MHNIFDSHAHYDDDAFNQDRIDVLKGLPQKGVCGIINNAINFETADMSIELADKFDFVFAAVGIYPHETLNLPHDYIDRLTTLLKHKKVVAIGEIGLDYHYDFSPRDVQKHVFEEQLKLAVELNMPVVVHDREAHSDTFSLLKKYKPRGVIHCFSGSVEMANEIIKIGMSIGLGGAVTFKNAKHPVQVAKTIPVENILLETDAPYMTPVPFRGKRCDSSHIAYTADKIAQIREMDTQELINITCNNAKRLFGIN